MNVENGYQNKNNTMGVEDLFEFTIFIVNFQKLVKKESFKGT